MHSIGRVGQAVNLAVERFVTVGETIADDCPEIKADMYEACKNARGAGASIERLCEITAIDPLGYSHLDGPLSGGSVMSRAARSLLGSVTRVLLLADIVVVKQLLLAKDKVIKSLGRLESVANFTEFVKAFSVFGAEMVELAHLTGDRQNDLKAERRKAQLLAARQVLERSTMMLLTSSKTCLRHLECTIARENRDTVFCQMRRAMDLIHFVVKDGIIESTSARLSSHSQTETDWDAERGTIYSAIKSFSCMVETNRPIYNTYHESETLNNCNSSQTITSNEKDISNVIEDCSGREFTTGHREPVRKKSTREQRNSSAHRSIKCPERRAQSFLSVDRESQGRKRPVNAELSILHSESRDQLLISLDKVVDKIQDFTDSAYTSHENREKILLLCNRCKLELNQCLRIAVSMEQYTISSYYSNNSQYDIDGAIDNVLAAIHDLSDQLAISVLDQANELHHTVQMGIDLVNNFRTIAVNQELDRLEERAERFHDYCDHILDMCKLLRHISLTEKLQVQAKFSEINLRIYSPQVITAAKILSIYPSSKIAKENLEVFVEMWQWLSEDVTSISKEILALTQNLSKPDRLEYQSLPRPGKHGTTSKPLKPARLDQEERDKIAKTGLEMKMLTNEMDAETEKWNGESEENNDIVKRAKNMSSMAFTMYQFTKGDGTLRTTQDLFTQAEYFAEEANRLYKVVRQFSYQVPAGQNKRELLDHLDKVPTYVQTLQFTVKDHTVGKAATFVKVDKVIRETKNLMNVINKVVTTCFECANKYKLDFSGLSGNSTSGSSRDDGSGAGGMCDSKGSTTSTEGSM